MPRAVFVCLSLLVCWSVSLCAETRFRGTEASYEVLRSILAQHCFGCHGPDKQKGDVRFDTLSPHMVTDRAAMETWHDALAAIQLGEMPPAKAKQLSAKDRQILVAWIRENVDRALESTQHVSRGVVLRRLNRDEYAYTMQDLLGLEIDYANDLPPDPPSHDGFLNNGAALGMSAMQIQAYLSTARRALELVLVDGDRPELDAQELSKRINLKRGLGKTVGENADRLGRVHYWAGQADRLPRTGRFHIRVQARAERVPDAPLPVMKVHYGYFVGGLTTQFLKTVGEIPISSEESTTIDFYGRSELFPMPELSVPVEKVQAVVAITNSLDDASPIPTPIAAPEPAAGEKRKKRNKKKKVYPEDPTFPKLIIESVELISNDYQSWPPQLHQQIVPRSEDLESGESIERVLVKFLFRAWRRPPTKRELRLWMEHFKKVRVTTETPIVALRETLAASLASSSFLYLVEPQQESETPRPLDDFEIASRLSYFLWSSPPDARLMELAVAGQLTDTDMLAAQFDRMKADEKFGRFVDQFVTQWLDLDSLQRVAVNPQYYKDFDDSLKPQMVQETKAFFAEVLRKDLSAMSFLAADFTMLNAALAKHYGLSGPKSQAFERVALASSERPGGLLAHAAMHMAGSDGVDSHPIKRAVWIRERLLNDPPAPPPPDVPSIEASVKGFQKLTVMEQLEVHRKKAACADCHNGIDPWGIALERYDAVGLYRDKIVRKRAPVDSTTVLPGGHSVSGLRDLQRYMLEKRRGQFSEALVNKLMTYALGRSLEMSDQPQVQELAKRFADNGYKLSYLMKEIVMSKSFGSR